MDNKMSWSQDLGQTMYLELFARQNKRDKIKRKSQTRKDPKHDSHMVAGIGNHPRHLSNRRDISDKAKSRSQTCLNNIQGFLPGKFLQLLCWHRLSSEQIQKMCDSLPTSQFGQLRSESGNPNSFDHWSIVATDLILFNLPKGLGCLCQIVD